MYAAIHRDIHKDCNNIDTDALMFNHLGTMFVLSASAFLAISAGHY